ncbi:4-hydroxythreonine-4-phosphate dehydrogenase PdxA [Candidatus Pelagibacter sp.]|uniref:4-hydroxythreonine-4-phosphate dehydrogenase PdxA n=1 Tax=Candidatus Pelagibacter sp. TaxID=2024849 RepID=UPI003D129A05
MKYKPIVIIAGEPNSVFIEIFLKIIKKNKFKSPLVLICSKKILFKQAKFLKEKILINQIGKNRINLKNCNLKKINLIDVDYNQSKAFQKISSNSNKYINDSFDLGLKIMKSGISNKLINGPISKEKFLSNQYIGITEYLAQKSKIKNFAMIIFNKELSVSPIITHEPLKYVVKKINKLKIIKKIKIIDKFWKSYFKKKAKIAITGLNPHCESIDKFNEDKKIILPAVKSLKKSKINIEGPLSADTIFTKTNRKRYNLIVGMYHDQVLTPIKTLFEYDAINLTVGLPFIRVSPDHGPNENMMGKRKSNTKSLLNCIRFLDY